MDLTVRLEVFEGPLDLLLHLLSKNKVNIYDIPIVEITEQYLAAVRGMQQEDMDLMSQFLVMAATLLDIKARYLLPKEEPEDGEEEDPRAELAERLLEYKMYRSLAQDLADRMEDAEKAFYKPRTLPAEVLEYEPPINLDELTAGVDLTRMQAVFESVLRRKEDRRDPVRSGFREIKKEEISVEEKMTSLEAVFESKNRVSFRELLDQPESRTEVVVTFLAILEWMKQGRLYAFQEETGGEILLERRDPR